MPESDPLSADYDLDEAVDGSGDIADHRGLIPGSPEEQEALHAAWEGVDPTSEMGEVRARYLAVGGQDGDLTSMQETYAGRSDDFWTLPDSGGAGGGFRGEAEHLAWDLRDVDALAIDVSADLTYLYGGDDPRVTDGGLPMEAVLEEARDAHGALASGLNLGGFSNAGADAIDAAQKQTGSSASSSATGGGTDFALDWRALGEVRNRLSRATEGIEAAVRNMDDPVRNAVQRTSEADTDALEMTMGLSNMLLAAYYDLTVAAVKIGTGMAAFTNAVTGQIENYQRSETAAEELFGV